MQRIIERPKFFNPRLNLPILFTLTVRLCAYMRSYILRERKKKRRCVKNHERHTTRVARNSPPPVHSLSLSLSLFHYLQPPLLFPHALPLPAVLALSLPPSLSLFLFHPFGSPCSCSLIALYSARALLIRSLPKLARGLKHVHARVLCTRSHCRGWTFSHVRTSRRFRVLQGASEREREREEKLFARHRIRFKYVTKSYFNGPRAGRGGGGGAGVRATRITLVPDVI
jgi:hypothetical protein